MGVELLTGAGWRAVKIMVRRPFCAVLLAWGLAASVASAQAPSPAPGYLADDYHQLGLGSNELMSGAKMVGQSYPLRLSPKSAPESYGPIWTFSCRAAAETVKFSRNVWLPGPPNYGGEFTYGSVLGRNEFSGLSTIDLIVNGTVIIHQAMPSGTGAFRVPVNGAALNAFHFGNNTITVRVHKRKTHGACNTHNPATQLGALFRLEGQFQTDLAVNPTPPDVYIKLAPNATYSQTVGVNFHNLGPGWEPHGTFQVIVTGAQLAGFSPPGGFLSNCQETHNGLSATYTCELSDFAPDASGILLTAYRVQAPSSDYTDFSLTYSVYIGAGAVTDLNSSNNQKFATFVFCGTKSTKPGCQTASAP